MSWLLRMGSQLVADCRGIVANLLASRPVVNVALLSQELDIESTNAHHYLNPSLLGREFSSRRLVNPATEYGVP